MDHNDYEKQLAEQYEKMNAINLELSTEFIKLENEVDELIYERLK